MTQNDNVVDLLNAYHRSPITHRLRERFLTPTIFDIIQKERSETVHSNFLKWMFDLQLTDKIEGFNIISLLLQIAYKRAIEQGKQDSFPNLMAKIAYGAPDSILLSNAVEREYRCNGVYCKSDGKSNSGIVDLVITGSANYKGSAVPFKIIIENKINSAEHDLQTWKYFTYFEGKKQDNTPDNIVIENKLYQATDNELRVYLFLSPESNPENVKCACPHFIKINYQDIMDHCITPLLECPQLNTRNRLFLDEYSRVLSLPYNYNDNTIMSLSPIDVNLLNEFWEANQKLISMSLQALAQTSQDADTINQALNSITSINKSRTQFTITYTSTGETKQTNQSNLMFDLMTMYNNLNIKPGQCVVSQYGNIGKVFCKDSLTTGYSKEWIKFDDGTKVRVTTQIQRYPDKLESIKAEALKDGFLIQ